jgi:hypothetical protein
MGDRKTLHAEMELGFVDCQDAQPAGSPLSDDPAVFLFAALYLLIYMKRPCPCRTGSFHKTANSSASLALQFLLGRDSFFQFCQVSLQLSSADTDGA